MSRATVRVVAPATLEEGFTFDVLMHGEPYTVTVPPGGVKEGQEFEIPYDHHDDDDDESSEDDNKSCVAAETLPVQSGSQDDDDDEGNSPQRRQEDTAPMMGRWRYPLLACCDVLTQATFWMACFCTPVLLAQLLARLRLSWKGLPSDSPQEVSLSFNRIVLTYVAVLVAGLFFPVLGFLLVILYVSILLVWIGSNVRRHVRQRYRIASTRLAVGGHDCLEDGLCMCLCGCCSLIQMARQTHNDKEYPGMCCTTTGLEFDAPQVAPLRNKSN